MDSRPKGNPFEKLAQLREKLRPVTPELRAEDFPEEPPEGGPARAVIRVVEREGKAETWIDELALGPAELEAWRLALQRGLAAQVRVEGGSLVAEGDHRLRLPDLVLRRGVKRVVQPR